MGVYPISLVHYLFGKPEKLISTVTKSETGVDDQSIVIMNYSNNMMAVLFASFLDDTSTNATIIGSKGKILIKFPVYSPNKLVIEYNSLNNSLLQRGLKKMGIQKKKLINIPYKGNGYNYEIEEVVRCVNAGECESKVVSLVDTLDVMEMIDEAKRQCQK